MKDRRKFLHQLTLLGVSIPISSGLASLDWSTSMPIKKDSIDWEEIRSYFLASSQPILNLNNGSAGIMPKPILDKYISYLYEINSFAPYEVNTRWAEASKENLYRLGQLVNAEGGDLAFVRNTTEAMNLVLWGLDWKEGDEIVKANWDYPLVDFSCEHIANNYGIKINTIENRLYGLSDDEIVELYRQQITDKTKLIMVTWITHREGMTLPVKKICDMARTYGVKVLADGAHTIGQIDIDLKNSGLDYFACSLHKWLNAPLGSGIMYIKDSLIPEHRPHISFDPKHALTTTKYDYLGTRCFHNLRCLGDALDFLDITGIQAKEERLKSLSSYWMDGVRDIDGISLYTDPERSCAVASLGIKDQSAGKLKNAFEKDFSIHVKTSSYPDQFMLRISPNIYTSFKDLDKFIDAVEKIASRY